jgi:hypothetical protein
MDVYRHFIAADFCKKTCARFFQIGSDITHGNRETG